MNALVGRRDDGYAASFGDPGDGIGTLGHLDQMLDKTGSSLWTPAVQGAKANVLAAAANLQDALHEKQMEDYQADLTRALASIALVVGRRRTPACSAARAERSRNTRSPSRPGRIIASGCAVSARAPAYGVVGDGSPTSHCRAARRRPRSRPDLNISRVVVNGDALVLYTLAAGEAAALVRPRRAAAHARRHRARAPAAHAFERHARSRRSATPPYTSAQAHAGAADLPPVLPAMSWRRPARQRRARRRRQGVPGQRAAQ